MALATEVPALLVTCVAFVMGFNKIHGAQMMLRAGADSAQTAEALQLIEQAHAMFTVAAVCGSIFVVLFIIQLIRHAVAKEEHYKEAATQAHAAV
ncbi:MAG: hypothetical protein ACTIH1_07340 [Corynebacterium casei]|uniref:hypothetical protein n=1 Tax=Corynebacterium casei TaxID=160386 RepID=UPI0026496FDC|nr:hypothetical protein [Corynebacterium casei]MDN5784156.1 hypothetical protein [Corynebacterium casei]MDN5827717.1 hypothetical protein [Corynebacterium casei]MDN5883463.1 hypothetical protein [Corynebacterium casei]MDN5903294.1 hypothetical protein [Corynebacterium casei]MDN6131471.1 hypothetical protein [Corynebacterium casei]